MRINLLIFSVFAAVSLTISGCAATPSVRQVRPVTVDLSRYTALQAVVEAGDHIRNKEGYDITASELRREFLANVVASGRYANVGTDTQSSRGLEARLYITEFNYVHGAARGAGGILAGRAVLNVTMTLKDSESGEVIGSVIAGHASSHSQGVFSPVTSTQITAIANELSAIVTTRK